MTEPTLPSAPTGWTFGTTPTFNPVGADSTGVTITKGNQAAAVTVDVTNSITRDTGSLKIKKNFDPLTSGFVGNFTIHYDCSGTQRPATLPSPPVPRARRSVRSTPAPSCTVTEPTHAERPPDRVGPSGPRPSISGSQVTITTKATNGAVLVTVTELDQP